MQLYLGTVVLWQRGGVIGAFYRISLHFTSLHCPTPDSPSTWGLFLNLMTQTESDDEVEKIYQRKQDHNRRIYSARASYFLALGAWFKITAKV